MADNYSAPRGAALQRVDAALALAPLDAALALAHLDAIAPAPWIVVEGAEIDARPVLADAAPTHSPSPPSSSGHAASMSNAIGNLEQSQHSDEPTPNQGPSPRLAAEVKYHQLLRDINEAKSRQWNIKSKDSPAACMQHSARLLYRLHNPFVNVAEAVTIGLMLSAGDSPEANEARVAALQISQEKREQCLRVFDWIIDCVPFMRSTLYLLEENPDDALLLGRFLDYHARAARACDINTIKENIRDWVPPAWLPEVGASGMTILPGSRYEKKEDLGFSTLWTARANVPRSLRDQFDRDPDEFCKKILCGEVRVDHTTFPSFVYKEGPYDEGNQAQGLFRGEPLTDAFRGVFKGATAARGPPGSNGSGHGSISRIYGLSSVRPESIAYIACLVRYVLSNSPVWEPDNGAFKGEEFYKRILKVFQNETFAKETLAYWDWYVYGSPLPMPAPTTATTSAQDQADVILQQLAQASPSTSDL
ncbi:hypothetical protein L227DRAFT_615695 [Lentinus tigrinus ALCF2SS1-6]|uniref:Uncharacterized protein n=1 Tax=Lentinus tigrinus ALCF2SS1-6 TaxID=1328759 RepID=A0A5C2RUN9_9APHY|nr:hypothetical protein L227DRAFT_615695 [Lentinus tigrinus ALCF2SS1-6]